MFFCPLHVCFVLRGNVSWPGKEAKGKHLTGVLVGVIVCLICSIFGSRKSIMLCLVGSGAVFFSCSSRGRRPRICVFSLSNHLSVYRYLPPPYSF